MSQNIPEAPLYINIIYHKLSAPEAIVSSHKIYAAATATALALHKAAIITAHDMSAPFKIANRLGGEDM